MLRKKILMGIGVFTALSPFIGIPHSWLTVLLPATGLATAAIAFTISLPVVRTVSHENETVSV